MLQRVLLTSVLLLVALTACGGTQEPPAEPRDENTAVVELTSSAFKEGETIPNEYTCDGLDVSPPLTWNRPPARTKSLALIADDPDAPAGTWVHWVLYDLPPDTASLAEDIPPDEQLASGGTQGTNSFRKIGYGGPCPPKGPAHRYFFKLYALDSELNLPAGATEKELSKAMEGHILAQGQLMGQYQR